MALGSCSCHLGHQLAEEFCTTLSTSLYIPRLGKVLLKFILVGSNNVTILVKDDEPGGRGSVIDSSNVGRHDLVRDFAEENDLGESGLCSIDGNIFEIVLVQTKQKMKERRVYRLRRAMRGTSPI